MDSSCDEEVGGAVLIDPHALGLRLSAVKGNGEIQVFLVMSDESSVQSRGRLVPGIVFG